MRKRRIATAQETLITTPIHTFVLENNLKKLSESIENSADAINVRDENYSTALDLAISNACFDAANLLLNGRADPNICNREGLTPFHVLVKNIDQFIKDGIKHENIIAMSKDLIKHKTDLTNQDRRGNTLINFIAQKAKSNTPSTKTYTRIGVTLLASDDDAVETVKIRNNMGKTPTDYLARNGNLVLRDAVFNCDSIKQREEHISKIVAETERAIKKASLENIEA
jgi:ankyrin repeat protein